MKSPPPNSELTDNQFIPFSTSDLRKNTEQTIQKYNKDFGLNTQQKSSSQNVFQHTWGSPDYSQSIPFKNNKNQYLQIVPLKNKDGQVLNLLATWYENNEFHSRIIHKNIPVTELTTTYTPIPIDVHTLFNLFEQIGKQKILEVNSTHKECVYITIEYECYEPECRTTIESKTCIIDIVLCSGGGLPSPSPTVPASPSPGGGGTTGGDGGGGGTTDPNCRVCNTCLVPPDNPFCPNEDDPFEDYFDCIAQGGQGYECCELRPTGCFPNELPKRNISKLFNKFQTQFEDRWNQSFNDDGTVKGERGFSIAMSINETDYNQAYFKQEGKPLVLGALYQDLTCSLGEKIIASYHTHPYSNGITGISFSDADISGLGIGILQNEKYTISENFISIVNTGGGIYFALAITDAQKATAFFEANKYYDIKNKYLEKYDDSSVIAAQQTSIEAVKSIIGTDHGIEFYKINTNETDLQITKLNNNETD